jgi:hypothetical protein
MEKEKIRPSIDFCEGCTWLQKHHLKGDTQSFCVIAHGYPMHPETMVNFKMNEIQLYKIHKTIAKAEGRQNE